MAKKNYTLDMSKGSIFINTFKFAIPLILASLLQLFYNAADLIIVSRFAGSTAMASVGATSSVTNLIVNVFVGISLGANVAVSRKFGARRTDEIKKTVHTAILLGITMGIASSIIGLVFSRPLLELMGTPEGAVLDGATLYMKIIFIGVPASMCYNFGASILRAVGDTKRPLYILAVSGVINILLNLVLVICFNMSVAGVAIATAVSNYISMIAILYILSHSKDDIKLNLRKLRFHKKELIEILKVGIPTGVQSSFFSLSNTVIQSAVNSFGETAIAGNSAAASLEGFVYVAINAFQQVTLTGVSQNYGAQNAKRVNKTIRVNIVSVIIVGVVLGFICNLFSRPLLGIYITDSAEALEYGVMRIACICLPYFLCGVMDVLAGALRGLGCSVTPAVTTFVGTCGLRVFWATAVLEALGGSIFILYLCWPISWAFVIVANYITLKIIKPKALRAMSDL